MSVKKDELQFDLIVNGNNARQELNKLQKDAAALKAEMKGIKDQELLGKKEQELSQLNSRMEEIRKEIGITGLTMKELSQKAATLKTALRNMDPNSAEFATYKGELKAVSDRMSELWGKAQQIKDTAAGSGGGMMERILGVAGGMGLVELARTGLNYLMQSLGQVKAVIDSTETSSDRWNQTITGLTWAWDTFKKSLATGDFSNFLGRIDQAIEKGREYASVLDILEKRSQSFTVYESQQRVKLEQLKIAEKDVALTKEQRIKAGIDALKIEQDLLNRKISIDKEAAGNEMNHAKVVTGLGDATIKKFVLEFEQNRKLIEQSETYIEAKRRLQAIESAPASSYGVTDKTHLQSINELNKIIQETPNNVKIYSSVVASMAKLSAEEKDKVINSWANMGKTEQEFTAESSRIKITKSKLEKGIMNEEEGSYKQMESKFKQHSEYMTKIQEQLSSTLVALEKNEKEKELKMLELDFQEKIKKIEGNSEAELNLRNAYGELYQKQKKDIENKYTDKGVQQSLDQQRARWEAVLNSEESWSGSWVANRLKMLNQLEAIELQKTELTEQEKQTIRERYSGMRNQTETKYQESFTTFTPGIDVPWQSGKGMTERADMKGVAPTDYSGKLEALKQQRDAELAIAGDSVEAQKQILADYASSAKNVYIEIANAAISAFSSIVSALSGVNSAMNDYENAMLKKDEASNEQKKANLKKQLDAKLITQKQYDAGVSKLDQEMDLKKKTLAREQARRQKALAIASAIINVAQAVTSALTAGPIIGIILAALVGILGAVQIAYIASTPIPEAAKGRYQKLSQAANGRYNVIGASDGKAYNDVPYSPSFTGIPGRPLLVNETGNEIVIDPYTTKNLQLNYPEVLQVINAARVPQRATGNYPVDRTQFVQKNEGPVMTDNSNLVKAIEKLNEHLSSGIRSRVVWTEIQDANKKMASIDLDVVK